MRIDDAANLAHGIGGPQDLPIPAFYAYAGAFTALTVSFLALGLLWPTSRFAGSSAGWPLPARLQHVADLTPVRHALQAAGLAAAGVVLAHLLIGPDDPDRNPAAGAVYVLFWVGLVPASVLFGPVWRLLNPLRTVHHLLCRSRRRDPMRGCPLPAWLGYWPAAAGLFAFTWLELASPEPASRGSLLAFVASYGALQLLAAHRYGSAWFDRGDGFEVYSVLLGHLSPLGRRGSDRTLVLRNPFHSLDAVTTAPGLAAVVCVVLGSTAYDSLSSAPWWVSSTQSSPLGRTAAATLGLAAVCLLVGALYAACAGAARLISGPMRQAGGPIAAFAHSLVPVAVGYLVAHYFTLFVTEAPRTVAIALGTDDPAPPPDLLGPGGTALLQVAAIIAGHTVGVVAAHDRAIRLFPPARAVAGQIPLLVLMVCYTTGGLTLLLAS